MKNLLDKLTNCQTCGSKIARNNILIHSYLNYRVEKSTISKKDNKISISVFELLSTKYKKFAEFSIDNESIKLIKNTKNQFSCYIQVECSKCSKCSTFVRPYEYRFSLDIEFIENNCEITEWHFNAKNDAICIVRSFENNTYNTDIEYCMNFDHDIDITPNIPQSKFLSLCKLQVLK